MHLNQFAAYRCKRNFALPDKFIPERWLGEDERFERDERFARDRREVVQPFAVGPRNCIGKNLAGAEILLVVSRVVAEFEIEGLKEEGVEGWLDQGAWFGWEKKPLMLRLRERGREGGL